MKSGRHSARRFQLLTWVVGLTSFLLVIGVGGAAAAVRMDAGNSTVNLNGIKVGGIELARLDAAAATKKLHAKFEAPLDAPITVSLDGEFLQSTTRRELGASTNVDQVYREAVKLHQKMPMFKRLWYRLTGMSVGHNLQVKSEVDSDRITELISKYAEKVNKAPVNASVSVTGASFRILDATPGFALDEKSATKALKEASTRPTGTVTLTGKPVAAAVTRANFKDVIVVKTGENKLYHYEGEQLVKTYDVATGLPKYPTPTGQFKIVQKRFRPTWVNPAKSPGDWGFKLPARIGPGPSNPLGTRAMNLNSPGIRIHGTMTEASLGYNASHGCIRMRMADVEELFDKVDVGTPVIVQSGGPIKLMPSKSKTPTIEDLVESDGAAFQGVDPAVVAPPPAPVPPPAPAAPAKPPAAPAAPAEVPAVNPPAAPGDGDIGPDLDLG